MKHIFNPKDPFKISQPLSDQCVSPSSINEFDQCPAKYLWNRIYKIEVPEKEYPEKELGLKIHKWAEEYFICSPTQNELLLSYCSKNIDDLTAYEGTILVTEHKYLQKQGLPQMNVLAVEQKISSWVNRRVGYVDRIDLRPDGNLTVVDYKPKSPKKYPANIRRQLTFYATQINFLIEQGLFLPGFPKSRVTHCRVIGYKDGSDWEFKLNKRSITALEKRIIDIRTKTEFLCKPDQPLCKFCKYLDNLCMESNLKNW